MRLVIDASVAHASGGEGATHPVAANTRNFLQAVLTICHKAVMSPAIREEWDRHQSKFARRWRSSMMARRKIILLEVDEREDIVLNIHQASVTQKQKDAMLKDCHLIESAIATDDRIVSLDDTARDLFKHELNIADVNVVMWVNPIVDAEKVLSWLKDGAPEHKEYKLNS